MKLYWHPIPPPCQAVLLTARYLGVELKLHSINIMKNEQRSDDFLRVNPLHTLPVLEEEDGFVLTESRAIMTYLAQDAGSRGAALLPSDPRDHALCLQWLWFDVTCLWDRLKSYHLPVVTRKAGKFCEDAFPLIQEALRVLDDQLKKTRFVVGDNLSLADLGLATTVAQAIAIGIDMVDYMAINTWYARLRQELPNFQETVQGSDEYAGILQKLMQNWKE